MYGNIFSPEYMISNICGLALIFIALWRPYTAKVLLAALFLGAAVFNGYMAVMRPGAYLLFADVAALPVYERFIRGYFSQHVTVILMVIAALQLLIGIFAANWRKLSKVALAGAAFFLLAIAPLGAGAAFPSSVLAAVACVILLFRKNAGPETFIKDGGHTKAVHS